MLDEGCPGLAVGSGSGGTVVGAAAGKVIFDPTGGSVGFELLSAVGSNGTRVGVAGTVGWPQAASNTMKMINKMSDRFTSILLDDQCVNQIGADKGGNRDTPAGN